jgi:hypothetical protein
MSDLRSKSKLLRRAMQLNGVFSTLSGLVFMAFSAQLAAFQGLEASAAPKLIEGGVVLLGFAAFLFAGAHFFREMRTPLLVSGAFAVALDLLYVANNAYALAAGVPSMNLAGKWTTVILAVLVLDFAVLQFLGLKRIWQRVPDAGEAHAVMS